MSNKAALEALNKTLHDIRGNRSVLDDITGVMTGDFRQTLPTIPPDTFVDEIKACIKTSYIWCKIRKLGISTNMRVHLYADKTASISSNSLRNSPRCRWPNHHERDWKGGKHPRVSQSMTSTTDCCNRFLAQSNSTSP